MIGLPTITMSRISSRRDAGLQPERRDQPVQRRPDGRRHLGRALGMHHRVAHPAHQVLAEADLRVHHAVAGEDRAVGEVREVAGDRRRADVDRDAVRPVVEAGPDRDDLAPVVDRDGHRVVALLERRLERPDDAEVGPEVRRAPTRSRAPPGAGRGRPSARRARASSPRRSGGGSTGSTWRSRSSRPLRTTWR